MKKLSFVIPCYGSENTIEYVINEIVEVVSQRSDYDYEIICVNDGSPDNVISVLEKLAAANSKIKVADFSKKLRQAFRGNGGLFHGFGRLHSKS